VHAPEIIPTVVPASLEDIETAAIKYRAIAPVLHVDFTDGKFAPNTTWLPRDESFTNLGIELEAHLMIQAPSELGVQLIAAGFSRIIGHVEAMRDASGDVLREWKMVGAKRVALGVLAQTPPEAIDPHAAAADAIMMMTITAIGVQGLPADPAGPARCAAVHARYPQKMIQVDGAVNEGNIIALAAAGVSSFCAGSVLSKASDAAATYKKLIALAASAAA